MTADIERLPNQNPNQPTNRKKMTQNSEEAKRKFTFLVVPCNEAGHFNAVTGSTVPLLARGHRVVFVIHESWRGKPASFGFEEFEYEIPGMSGLNPVKLVAQSLFEHRVIGPYDPKQKLQNFVKFFESDAYATKTIATNGAVKAAIAKYSPDAIIIDDHLLLPAIFESKICWIKNCSMAPTFETFDADVPPGGSGFPTDGDRTEWPEYNRIRAQLFFDCAPFNDFLQQKMGYARYPDDSKFPATQSLTIYAWPDEINFASIRRRADWFNLEAFHKPKTLCEMASTAKSLRDLVPEKFYRSDLGGVWSGKWIYVGMGTLGLVDLEMIRRLLRALATTPHKFIVSKGPLHEQIDLPANAWGESYLPQLEITPLVDLVITHGGNNTTTETFAMGKSMLVLPMFVDQYDNAQRLAETGYGARLDPYEVDAAELAGAIDRLLADQALREKMQIAAKRIQQTDTHRKLAQRIERILEKEDH